MLDQHLNESHFHAVNPTERRMVWLALPMALAVGCLTVGFLLPSFYTRYFESESGVVENLTVLLLCLAIGLAGACLRLPLPGSKRPYLIWTVLFLIAMVLYAGEEISWGQHLIGWEASGIFAERGQKETNIHNIHPFLSQAPRALVVSSVIVAGVILPLTRLGRMLARKLPGSKDFWLWALPARVTALSAAMVLLIKLPKRTLRWLNLEEIYWPGHNDNELVEVFLALFFVMYALTLYNRLRRYADDLAVATEKTASKTPYRHQLQPAVQPNPVAPLAAGR